MKIHEDWIAGAPSATSDEVEDEMFNTRPRTDIPGDDGMMDEFITDTPTDMENTPAAEAHEDVMFTIASLNAKVESLSDQVKILTGMLAPVAPIIAALPELMSKVGPLIDGIEKSPVLKILGIQLGKKP
jgi:hypothetical protein